MMVEVDPIEDIPLLLVEDEEVEGEIEAGDEESNELDVDQGFDSSSSPFTGNWDERGPKEDSFAYPESDVTVANLRDDSSFGELSFYDPILFKVDEILGGEGLDYENEGLDYVLHNAHLPVSAEDDQPPNDENHLTQERLYPEFDASASELTLNPRKDSEDAFFNSYMAYGPTTPDLMERLSREAVGLETRPISPCENEVSESHTIPRMHECPSIESFLRMGEPVHIQFSLLPGPKLFTHAARFDRTIFDIKMDISPICQVPAEFLELRKNRTLLMDHRTLLDIGAKPQKKLKLTVELSKRCPAMYEIKIPEDPISVIQLPPVHRKIKIASSSGWKTVSLEIEYEATPKLYLGGFRDKRCGGLYYNAATQTVMDEEPILENLVDFSCQTFNDTSKEVQTLTDQYQQTERRDYYLSQKNTKIIWAKQYVSTDFMERKRVEAAIIIQKYWRRWLAIRERAERLDALLLRVEWAENIRKGRTEVRMAILKEELRRQHNPTTMLDIELLYRAIDVWRRKELEYIEMYRWGPDRKAAIAQVTEMELDLILDLEKAKNKIRKGLKNKMIENTFRKMSEPTRGLNRSDNFMSWDTPNKFTSRQYTKLYYSLMEPVTNLDERFCLLQLLYEHIRWHDSAMTKYLIDLIGRELEMSKLSQSPQLLHSVRKRMANAFYNICRDPTFNPEAKRLDKTPFDLMKLRKDMFQCKGCRQVLNRDQFPVVNGVSVSNTCCNCTKAHHPRKDLNLYRYMLNELRNDEYEAKVKNSVTFLIDAHDLQFLVEQVWHGQSALSGMDNRYLLRFCRWNRDLPWSPWNCVLLAEEEAVAHVNMVDLNSAYQPYFVDKVKVKHQAARIHFARLTALSIPLDPKLSAICAIVAGTRKKKKELKSKDDGNL